MTAVQIIKDVVIFNIGYFVGVIAALFIYKGKDNKKPQRQGYQPSTLSAERLRNIKPPKTGSGIKPTPPPPKIVKGM